MAPYILGFVAIGFIAGVVTYPLVGMFLQPAMPACEGVLNYPFLMHEIDLPKAVTIAHAALEKHYSNVTISAYATFESAARYQVSAECRAGEKKGV